MSVESDRFQRNYGPVAEAISRADVGQVERELIAVAVGDAFDRIAHDTERGRPAAAKVATGWNRGLFVAIASDPIVECCGYTDLATGEDVPCPNDRWTRVPMHLSSAPDGRSFAWRQEKPTGWRCVSCGAKQFIPGHQKAV